MLKLQIYDMDISYRPGEDNVVADALSRQLCSATIEVESRIYQSLIGEEVTLTKEESRLKNLFIEKEGRLYRKQVNEYPEVPVPPEEERNQIVQNYHLWSAHGNHHVTFALVRSRYFWLRMRSEIRSHVRGCIDCQRQKSKPANITGMLSSRSLPFQKVYADTIGPIGRENQQKFIVTVVDDASRFAIAGMIPHKSAEEVAKFLINDVFFMYGFPESIQTDRGTEFNNEVLESCLLEANIEHPRSSPYSPHSNGRVERFNGTLKKKIAKLVQCQPYNWVKYLKLAVFAYNISRHSATGLSPFEMMYGRTAYLPGDHQMTAEVDLAVFQSRRRELWGPFKRLMEEERPADERMEIGQIVWKRKYVIQDPFEPLWEGPFIIEDIGHESMSLCDPFSSRQIVAHKKDVIAALGGEELSEDS
jgi:transposase InsO family protein